MLLEKQKNQLKIHSLNTELRMQLGDELIESGWRQGSVVRAECVLELIQGIPNIVKNNSLIVIIASQSCDISYNTITDDPTIEISIAYKISKQDGNCTFNKNARKLHTKLHLETGDTDVFNEVYIELKAHQKYSIFKQLLHNLQPDTKLELTNQQLEFYVLWLAARYSRPALPTEFNNRLMSADQDDKRKKIAKKLNKQLSGLYIEIIPYKEITSSEHYKVNLLGLVSPDFVGDITTVNKSIVDFETIMKKAGMDVRVEVSTEDKISIATLKRFKRFYYDDLSFKKNAPKPIETELNL